MICGAAEKSPEKGGGMIVFMGVNEGNLDRLKEGLPITIKLSEKTQGKLDSELYLFYGRTDEDLKRMIMGDGEVSAGEVKEDVPKSIRQEFMESTEELLKQVSLLNATTPGIDDAVRRTTELLGLMRRT